MTTVGSEWLSVYSSSGAVDDGYTVTSVAPARQIRQGGQQVVNGVVGDEENTCPVPMPTEAEPAGGDRDSRHSVGVRHGHRVVHQGRGVRVRHCVLGEAIVERHRLTHRSSVDRGGT